MSVKLYVRDNTNGQIHEYGTSRHDALILMEDGSLHYENMQCMCGTQFPEEGYTFVLEDGSDPRDRGEYFGAEADSYIDIGGNGEWREIEKEAERAIRKAFESGEIEEVYAEEKAAKRIEELLISYDKRDEAMALLDEIKRRVENGEIE